MDEQAPPAEDFSLIPLFDRSTHKVSTPLLLLW